MQIAWGMVITPTQEVSPGAVQVPEPVAWTAGLGGLPGTRVTLPTIPRSSTDTHMDKAYTHTLLHTHINTRKHGHMLTHPM